jgi:hypothetical protein
LDSRRIAVLFTNCLPSFLQFFVFCKTLIIFNAWGSLGVELPLKTSPLIDPLIDRFIVGSGVSAVAERKKERKKERKIY